MKALVLAGVLALIADDWMLGGITLADNQARFEMLTTCPLSLTVRFATLTPLSPYVALFEALGRARSVVATVPLVISLLSMLVPKSFVRLKVVPVRVIPVPAL